MCFSDCPASLCWSSSVCIELCWSVGYSCLQDYSVSQSVLNPKNFATMQPCLACTSLTPLHSAMSCQPCDQSEDMLGGAVPGKALCQSAPTSASSQGSPSVCIYGMMPPSSPTQVPESDSLRTTPTPVLLSKAPENSKTPSLLALIS